MQVKKFEAPTIQEALEVIKRELGPEAIILQTRKMKKGFGLMSRESVEVTAAVSERSIQKKSFAEHRLRDSDREAIKKLPAQKQGDLYDKYLSSSEKRAASTRDRVELGGGKRITATRYADIADVESPPPSRSQRAAKAPPAAAAAPRVAVPPSPSHQAQTLEAMSSGRMAREEVTGLVAQGMAEMSVEQELKHLKRMVEEMKTTQSETPSPGGGQAMSTPALQDAFEQLVLNGMERRYAHGLLKKVAFEIGDERARNPEYVLDQLAVEVMQSTEITVPLGGATPEQRQGPRVIALVGPTGVGKTTTVAKIASLALLRRNLKVGLINLDSYKVAAFDQLGTYAKILNVPFRSVESAEELSMAVRDFSSLDLVIVDTTGRSQKDPESLKEMQQLLQAVPQIETQLVLAVTTRDNELYDQANRFSIFRPRGVIVSKLDEASIYGAIYNISNRAKLPISYFTTGQRVPEDIEEATRERVAALIMDL